MTVTFWEALSTGYYLCDQCGIGRLWLPRAAVVLEGSCCCLGWKCPSWRLEGLSLYTCLHVHWAWSLWYQSSPMSLNMAGHPARGQLAGQVTAGWLLSTCVSIVAQWHQLWLCPNTVAGPSVYLASLMAVCGQLARRLASLPSHPTLLRNLTQRKCLAEKESRNTRENYYSRALEESSMERLMRKYRALRNRSWK